MRNISQLPTRTTSFLGRITVLAVLLATASTLHAAGGFFRVEQRNGKWFVIDPAGKPFHMRGCNHYSNGTRMPWNLKECCSNDPAKWTAELRDRHRDWGFTFLASSIGGAAIDPATLLDAKAKGNLVVRVPEWTAEERIWANFPFTPFLGVPQEYMAGERLGDVWGDKFISAVDERCRELVAPLKDNKMLIGYHFSHNPPWNNRARSFELWIKACRLLNHPARRVSKNAALRHSPRLYLRRLTSTATRKSQPEIVAPRT